MSDRTENAAIMIFPEDEAFVEYCNTSIQVDILSLCAVRIVSSFQLKCGEQNISFFDSNAEPMSLPHGITRLVAFKCSTSTVVMLFQLKNYIEHSLFLVSAYTSLGSNLGHRNIHRKKLNAIQDLGHSVMQSLTLFNNATDRIATPGAAPIAALYIPPFPKALDIRAKISDEKVFTELSTGLEKAITTCSPRVEIAF